MKKIILALAFLFGWVGAVFAAALIPNGKQQFVDGNGVPLSSGTVEMYFPATTVQKNTWQDINQTTLNTNPIVLDADGRAVIFGDGVYRQVVKDSFGNLVWDQITADPASNNSSWGGTSTGTANLQVVPNGNFTATDGQVYAFKAGYTNTAGLTLTVTGVGSYQVRKDTQGGPVALQGGEVTAGNVVTLVYDSGLGVFHMVSFAFSNVVMGSISFNNTVALNSKIAPPALSANVNDWAPGGITSANQIFISSSATYNVTGISAGQVAGRVLWITNVGSFPIGFVSESASSTATNRFTLNSYIQLKPNNTVAFFYDLASSRWKQLYENVPGPLVGSFVNLSSGVTGNASLNIIADQLVVSQSSTSSFILSNVSVACDITTSGLNGLDTGTEAINTWYAIFVVANNAGQTGCLLSLSPASPTLPSGYTYFYRTGWVRNNASSNFIPYIQYQKEVNLLTFPTLISGASVGAPVSITSTIPATAAKANVALNFSSNVASWTAFVSTNSTADAVIAAGNNYLGGAATNAATGRVQGELLITATTLYYASSSAGVTIYVIGWEDR